MIDLQFISCYAYSVSNLKEDTMQKLRWLTYLLIITILVAVAPIESSAQSNFTDVKSSDEFYEHVNYIANKKIIKGYPNGEFRPAHNITRFQAAKMLIEATGKENHPANHVKFTNISINSGETYTYLSKAVDLGYFKKTAAGAIHPQENINRDELAYALAVAFNLSAKVTDKPLMLPDVANHPYVEKINGLYHAGITQGSEGSFMPNSLLTRGQFSQFVARALNSNLKLPVKLPGETSKTSFVKVNTPGATLNVRQQPSATTASTIIGKFAHGTIVEVYEVTNGWWKINYNGKVGYISKKYTLPSTGDVADNVPPPAPKPTNPVTPPAATTGKLLGKVTTNSLNVRSGTGTSNPVIGKVTLNQKVEVLQLSGNWAKIKYGSSTGYVSKIYLKLLNQSAQKLKDRIIVLDAGHGGHDPGASSKGVTEKSTTLKVTKLVEAKLKRAGAKVLLTRSNDSYLTLKQRTDFAKNNFAETFVSIHFNAATASAKGAEVWIDSSTNPNAKESRTLASIIQKNIVNKANMVDRGVRDNGFYVVKNNNVASVLIELGFITNADDFKKLSNDKFLEIYAEAIYQGLVQYYSMD